MKLYEIVEAIEKRVPKEWAEPCISARLASFCGSAGICRRCLFTATRRDVCGVSRSAAAPAWTFGPMRSRSAYSASADVSYHPREEAAEAGLCIAACDHGEMERVSLPALAALVAEQTGLPVTIVDGEGADMEDGFGGR